MSDDNTTPRTADNAPTDTAILVWVADVDAKTGRPVGWRMGRCHPSSHGQPASLYGEGMNGGWTIETWHPLPPDHGSVTAVNAHDDLVKALEKIAAVTYGTEINNTDEENLDIISAHFFRHQAIARSALAKAKGEMK